MCLCTYFKMYSRAVHTNNLTAYCIMYILFVLHLTNSPLHLPHNVLQLKSSPLHLPYNVLHLTSGPLYFLLGLGNPTDSLFNNPKLDNGLGYNITKLSRRNLRIILIIIKRNPDLKKTHNFCVVESGYFPLSNLWHKIYLTRHYYLFISIN